MARPVPETKDFYVLKEGETLTEFNFGTGRGVVNPIKKVSTVQPKNPNEFKKPFELHFVHVLLHLFTGFVVFVSGVACSRLVESLWDARPVRVHWAGGEVQPDYRFAGCTNLGPGAVIELGFSEDGRVTFRANERAER